MSLGQPQLIDMALYASLGLEHALLACLSRSLGAGAHDRVQGVISTRSQTLTSTGAPNWTLQTGLAFITAINAIPSTGRHALDPPAPQPAYAAPSLH